MWRKGMGAAVVLLMLVLAGCVGSRSPAEVTPTGPLVLEETVWLSRVWRTKVDYVRALVTTYAPDGRKAVGPASVEFYLDTVRVRWECMEPDSSPWVPFCTKIPYTARMTVDAGYDVQFEFSALIHDSQNWQTTYTWRRTVTLRGVGTQIKPEPGTKKILHSVVVFPQEICQRDWC